MTQRRFSIPAVGGAYTTLAVVVLLDQFTKFLAVRHLPPREAVPVLGEWFRLLLVRNPGAAFSLGTDATPVLATVQLIAVAVCLYLAFRVRGALPAVTVGLIGGGAAGNLLDRIFRAPGMLHGHVVDFFSFWNFAIFNVADIAISCGVVLYLIYVFFIEPKNTVHEDERTTLA